MLAVFAMGAAVSGSALADASDLVLRYDKPGAKWTEALVLGNGRLGGMVWGGVEKERIQLNEDTLWSGEPRVLQRADTLAALPEIRKLLLEGKTKAAAELVNQKMLGPWNQSYMPLGDLLVEFDAPGAPATSFESSYSKPDGEVNWVCMGPTMDMQIVRDLYQNVVEASRILGEDAELRARLEKDLKRLAPNQVSPTTGRLQEWPEDWENADPRSGQVAQGWGLVPGSQIHPRRTPELAAAMRKTLEFRRPWETNNCASWTGSWAANMWARLGDGDKAAMVLDTHFKQALNPNLSAHFMGGVDWEIDGNLGITAAIAEMLLQSHEKKDEGGRMKDEEIEKDSSPYVIELLPALPKVWAAQGNVKGLKARGNVTVDIEWKDGKVTDFKLRCPSAKPVAARINGESKTITPEKLQ
jgi:hypothetical protein